MTTVRRFLFDFLTVSVLPVADRVRQWIAHLFFRWL